MKINYKIVTLILAGILIITYAWHWEDIFYHNKSCDMKMGSMNMSNGHMMSDGKMMSSGSMNMGGIKMNGNMMDMTMGDMLKMMEGKTGKALEKEFITGMIPHHVGAVEMSKRLLQDKTISAEMKKFAEDIINAQEGEIKMMKTWLETKYK